MEMSWDDSSLIKKFLPCMIEINSISSDMFDKTVLFDVHLHAFKGFSSPSMSSLLFET